jgi:hypothetical protein
LAGWPAEATGIPCLALAEIAAEKLSALCWRMQDEGQPDRRDLVRHLHDLACLSSHLRADQEFANLLFETVEADLEKRAKVGRQQALERLRSLPGVLAPHGAHYLSYINQTSYASGAASPPAFDLALNRLETLLDTVLASS